MSTPLNHAVVIGGSIAGLMAARVLSDYFSQVTILERDHLPDPPASRAGVPQDRHVHVLLQRGAMIAGRLFPTIEETLQAAGAHRVDLIADAQVKLRGQWLERYPSDKFTFACSRILLESVMRQQVQAIPNIAFESSAQVLGLVADGDQISGVHVRWKNRDQEDIQSADLVVDASGRTSKAPQWLAEIGYDEPEESVIDVQLGYAGRRYQAPTDGAFDWKIMMVSQQPPVKSRAGLIYSEEEGVWMVMLAGILGDYPPTDEAGFDAFARTVDPRFFAAMQAATPITKIFGYRKTENRYRRYEKLTRWPERFIVLGDAVCGFNPVYGQGMTVAAMAADCLGATLRQANGQLEDVTAAFRSQYPKVVEPAWRLATSADLEWLDGQNAVSAAERLAAWYLSKLLDTIPAERLVRERFFAVQNLMLPLSALFGPRVMARVLRHWMRSLR